MFHLVPDNPNCVVVESFSICPEGRDPMVFNPAEDEVTFVCQIIAILLAASNLVSHLADRFLRKVVRIALVSNFMFNVIWYRVFDTSTRFTSTKFE